jgi:hypothetical protein
MEEHTHFVQIGQSDHVLPVGSIASSFSASGTRGKGGSGEQSLFNSAPHEGVLLRTQMDDEYPGNPEVTRALLNAVKWGPWTEGMPHG